MNNPTPKVLLTPRLRSTHPAVDPEGFFDVVNTALQIHLKTEQTSRDVFYAHTFPKERLGKVDQPFDGVVYRLVGSTPSATDNGGSRIQRAPQIRQVVADSTAQGYNIVTTAWKETVTAEFKIYSKASDTRGELVSWFHRFIMRYAYPLKYFGSYGISLVQLVGRGEDGFEVLEEQELYFGLLTYQFQLEFIDSYSERIFDQITLNISTGQDLLTVPISDS